MKKTILTIICFTLLLITSCKKNGTNSEADPLELQMSPTHVSTFGESDGSINLTVTGGTLPYQYDWSNGESTEDLYNLTAGTYSVIVTDAGIQTENASININEPDPDNSDIIGAYFNKSFPTAAVARFAPDIFTEELHSPPIFSPNGDEVFWSYMTTPFELKHMEIVNGVWTDPIVPFNLSGTTDAPFISPDGTKLIFLGREGSSRENIYVVEKINNVWGSPSIIEIEVNDPNWDGPHWQASVANNQNLYFAGSDIYFSEYVNGSYTIAQKLNPTINTDVYESCPFVAPDESYLIFDREMPNRYADIFICFKQDDGSWGEPINMEELNGTYHELYANVSPDGRFIMFLSNSRGLDGLVPYWVDASIIDDYR
ncbi:hypothetical protein ACFLZA_02615 [Candidatus Neomarinimicrobiota bacterium]